MTDTPVTHHLRRDLSIDQQLALKTAATRLQREYRRNLRSRNHRTIPALVLRPIRGRATIPNFLPLLAERFARQRLNALARVKAR